MDRSAFLRAAGALPVVAVAPRASSAAESRVTVFAAASLREAFEAAAPEFAAATGYAARFVFGGSDTLAAQLEQGAPADVFASANELQMRRVAGLVGPPVRLARNVPVAIVSRRATRLVSLSDFAAPGVRIVLAAPSVPIGAYARRAFATLAARAAYGAAYAERVAANVVSEETDVKAVVTKVELGEGDAGVVYATDVTPAVAARVRVLPFPPGTAPVAAYPIAVVRAGADPAGAQAFVRFMTSARGAAALRARGFLR